MSTGNTLMVRDMLGRTYSSGEGSGNFDEKLLEEKLQNLRSQRKEVAQKRRNRLKRDAEDMINQALEEYYE